MQGRLAAPMSRQRDQIPLISMKLGKGSMAEFNHVQIGDFTRREKTIFDVRPDLICWVLTI